ncbi:class I SAM-dependent methyltransferase [Sporomusa acidovorans]|uniref:Ubiquinone biosynthesis O-methyltransferase, mitochondrial n=1 Tax=Sporomusa acidovorans (strain ATCC 49682 / DSM 3132 / Mol) TaxID=1123286 RepID=A0ABZ3J2S5_SPOA4|nr:class I SAM-dependent methyltransferase [Sporomusa acidovorans]OZC20180.1 dTDP-3-amino-3,4,6-trideoxy-alpha-D-glucopyranose [Sporomusa acidovorans DSM 3132]SDD42845.1 Methyltransferase domain-containing protein [Sporomusa acidovorans]
MTHEIGDYKTYSLAGTDQEVRFITNVLNLSPGQSILDLYCGYGRHAIELAKQGFEVTGVDATQDFLDIAAQKAQEANVNITFTKEDMRELNYVQNFAAVINMFAAFGYFTDDENANIIKLVVKALQPNGLFLIDLLNRDWMVHNNLNRYWRHPSGEYVLTYKVELEKGIVTMKRQLINQVTGTKTQYQFVLRAYSLPEMVKIFRSSGLSVLSTYGGFDGRSYSSETPRMIILAKKNP